MRKAVITIHGVLTPRRFDGWQEAFRDLLKNNQPKDVVCTYHPFKYGFLGPVIAWIMTLGKVVDNFIEIPTPIRDYYVKKFCKYILKVYDENPNSEISIVSHSFGGWIAEKAIERLSKEEMFVCITSLIYIHCPISCHIEHGYYRSWLDTGRVKKVHSWSSKNDMIINFIAIPPFGQNGVYGFISPKGQNESRKKPYSDLEIHNERTGESHGGVIDKLSMYGKIILEQL